jgi:nucleoside 2-deoxyribosyltransferase
MKRVYLAGPEVFLPRAREIGLAKRGICKEFGLDGLFPMDSEIDSRGNPADTARAIYAANLRLMTTADLAIANMTPFRGPGMDAGTAFEMGFMAALRKPVFAYTNRSGDYAQRVRESSFAAPGCDADVNGMAIEDFGLVDNLMMACAAETFRTSVVVLRDRSVSGAAAFEELSAFRACVELASREIAR